MNPRWQQLSFAELSQRGELAFGDGYRAKLAELGGNGPIFLRAGMLSESGLDWTGPERFNEELIDRIASKMGLPGDTMITTKGNSVGRTAYVHDDAPEFVYSPHLSFWRSLDHARIEPGFLRYWSQGSEFREQLQAMAHGTDMAPYLSLADQNRLVVTLPDIESQRGIAATLSALDDKIESNRRATALLEELGATLVESAFALDVYGFPDYDPERRLGDVLAVLETGKRPKGGVVASNIGVVSLGAESIQSAGVIATTKFKRVPREFTTKMRRGHLADGDVLVYKDGGTPGNFTPHVSGFGQGFPVPEATINEHVYRVRAIAEISQGLLYWLLRSPWMDQEMRKRGTGVAVPGLNSTNFKDLPLPVIDRGSISALNQQLDPMFRAMLRFGAESTSAAALRDALLPELLSGRIRVRETAEALG